MPRIDDFFAELAAVRSYSNQRRGASARASAWSVQQASNVAMAARLYPDLRPGALLALGKGNYRPDHPLARDLARISAQIRLHDHPAGINYGQSTYRGAMDGNRAALTNQAVNYASGQARRRAQWASPPEAVRYAAWQANRAAGLIAPPEISDEELERRVAQYAEGDVDREAVAGFRAKLERERITFRKRLSQGQDVDEGSFLGELQQATGTQPTTGQRVMTAGPSDVAEQAFTTPVRSAFMALDAPVQELQGQIRNLYSVAHGDMPDFWEPQSDLGVLLSEFATSGEVLASGTGFFVDQESEVARERRRREQERGQIGGHNITLGRWATDLFTPFDPDTRPAMILSGLLDAGVQLKGDPSALALGQVGKARQAKALFAAPDAERAAGLWRGARWMVNPVEGARYLDATEGQDVLRVLAAERSPAAIWQTMNRKVPITLANRLADANTPEAVRAILEPELGVNIRRVGDVGPLAGGTAKANPLRIMPTRGRIDAHDPDVVAWEIDAYVRNAKGSEAKGRALIDKVARAGNNPAKLNAVIQDLERETGGLLDMAGTGRLARTMTPKVKQRLTALVRDSHKEASDTFRAQVTANTPTYQEVLVSGRSVQDGGAHLWSELAPRYVTLPDARAVRRNVSKYSWALTTDEGEARLPTIALEHVINDVWKPLQLIRAAWTVRVIGEEQLRMAAAGYDSMFRHPGSFIAHRVGAKGQLDVNGNLISEANAHKAAMSVGHGGWADHAQVPTGVRTTFFKGRLPEADRFLDSWQSEIARLAHDPVSQQVARSDSMDDAVEWFTRGAGNRFRGDLAAAHKGNFDDLDQARAYIETVQQRIDIATGGHSDLLDAVRTGKLGGDDLISGTTLNGQARQRLEGYVDGFAPDEIMGEEVVTVPKGARDKFAQRMDRFTDTMFALLMTNRTNNLSRSPTFKQAYWREAERLIGFATEDTKQSIIRQAQASGLGSRAVRRMERTAARGEATLDDVDFAAKAHGLDETKTLLYDLNRKGRFMDAARLIFPFGEAWSELVTRWLGPNGLVANNPQTVRRFQQIVQGARGEDFGEVMGAPEGKGFFWINEFGEEVFVYPGSGILTENLLRVLPGGTPIPIPLTGRVQGLNMFGSIVPGFGPAVQLPLGWLLTNKPGPQFVKEALGQIEMTDLGPLGTVEDVLLPFGSAGAEDQSELWDPRTYMPPYMKSVLQFITDGDVDGKAWANSVMSYAAYLRTSGRYGNSRADTQKLMEDAEKGARWFHLVRGLGQFVLPSAPAADWRVVDPDNAGATLRLRALAEEYADMRADNFETADETFLDRYGEDILAVVQPRSKAAEYGLPTTKQGAQWVIEHPGIERDLPHTYGFFAPTSDDPKDFDYSLYEKQLREGDRVMLDPDTWTRLQNQTKGDIQWYRAKESVEGYEYTEEGRAFLADVRQRLYDEYPGWGDSSGQPERPEPDVLIRELQGAVGNKAIRDTDAGRALDLYLDARAEVIGWAESEGHSRSNGMLSTSKDVEEGHVALREWGDRLVRRYPGFESLWDVVLSRELEEVDDGT